MRNALRVYGAGSLGGLIYCLAMWLAGRAGLPQMLDVAIAPGLSPHWLYPRLVWAGLWGFLFLLPVMGSRWLTRTFVLALVPTLIQLFVIYPYITGAGVAGLELGALTPLVTYLFCWVWALATAISLKL